jgi:3-oxoacyl-[acyl-carrier protein] reductase
VVDITDEESIKNLIEFTMNKFGRIDVLAQNAGIFPSTSLFEMTPQD